MKEQVAVLAAERLFFDSLLGARVEGLTQVLGEDFVLIDLTGAKFSKAGLIELVGSGRLIFEAIDQVEPETAIRVYGSAAVVTGRTSIRGRAGENSFVIPSRYTHVYVEDQERWKLVSAQGTPVAAE